MQLDYKITLTDWKDALRVHAHQKLGRRIHYFIYDFVFPTLAVLGVALLAYLHLIGDAEAVDNLLLVVGTLVIIAIILPLVRQFAIRKSFKGIFPPSADGPGYSLDINAERIVSTRPGIGDATYYWAGICAVARSKKIILLYLSDMLFLGIPIHVLSAEQLGELEDLISRRFPKEKP